MVKIALFDFDGTITKKDTLFDFLSFTFGHIGLVKLLLRNTWNLSLYAIGLRSNEKAKEILLSKVLTSRSAEEFKSMCYRYATERVPLIIKRDVWDIITQHKEAGNKLYIVSASPEDWILPWATKNGFTDVIATKLGVKNGKLTGCFSTRNCYGKEKVKRLNEIFINREDFYIYAYGDSKSDSFMLEYANEGYLI